MSRSSRLARLQQVIVIALALAAAYWLLAHWQQSPGRAVAGALVIGLCHAWVLALQNVMLWFASRGDSAPRPTVSQLVRGWWAETFMAIRVFYGRQPFGWRAEPDDLGEHARGRRGIVFIHGFICNRGLWTPWLERVRRRGQAFVAVNLEPVFGSIDDYVPVVDEAVREVTAATGMPPVLVCHSMGGLAARAWLRAANEPSRVHRVITIASPHHGTWLARFSHMPNGIQMRMHGEWLRRLEQDEAARPQPPFTCWYSHCDNIVFPTSSAMLEGADNRLVRGPAHLELAFDERVIAETLDLAT